MKVKKIAKRLRKLSAEFHTRARGYDGENEEAERERARLVAIADTCQLLADEVFSTVTNKRDKRDPIVSAKNGWAMDHKAVD